MLQRHYKKKISGFKDWEQLSHSEDYLIYPENIGEHLSIDEVSLSKGELYTFVTNKNGRGKKKTLVASIKGTKSQDIIGVLNKIPLDKRKLVKEITLDMANNMQLASRMCFLECYLVTDRFHVVKLIMEALQYLRIKYRWEEIEKENQAIKIAKEQGLKYIPKMFLNEKLTEASIKKYYDSNFKIATQEEWKEAIISRKNDVAYLILVPVPVSGDYIYQHYIVDAETSKIYALLQPKAGIAMKSGIIGVRDINLSKSNNGYINKKNIKKYGNVLSGKW